jgi:VCBS repeat-containing protein
VTEDGSLSDSGTLTVSDVDDGEAHTQAASGSTALGTFSVDANGNWSYSVNNAMVQHLGEGDTDTDGFTVFSFDGTASQQVTVTIHGMNDAPTLADTVGDKVMDTVAFDDFQAVNGTLGGDDVDNGAKLTYALDEGEDGVSAFGKLVVNTDGSYTYDPNDAAINALSDTDLVSDTFAVRVTDEHGAFAIAKLTVTLDGANDAPLAAPDTVLTNVPQGTSFVIPAFALLANDTDVEGDPLTLSLGDVSPNGHVSLDSDGNVLNRNPSPDASFKYTAFDGTDHSALADVSVETQTDDTLIGTSQNQILIGSDNHDTVASSSDFSMLFGGKGVDSLQSSGNNNMLFGGDDGDTLQALTGADNTMMDGGAGDDMLLGGIGTTTMDGGAGSDFLAGGGGTNIASYASAPAGVKVDLSSSMASEDGHGSIDFLFEIQNVTGSAFDDTLTGDGFANVLTGGAGNDMLAGGLGNDIFDYNLLADRGTTGDVITDFQKGSDDLDLHDLLSTFDGIASDHSDAFDGGFLRFEGTQVQVDSDGGGDSFVTLATMNVALDPVADSGDYIL